MTIMIWTIMTAIKKRKIEKKLNELRKLRELKIACEELLACKVMRLTDDFRAKIENRVVVLGYEIAIARARLAEI